MIKFHLDTDIGGDIDDLCALALVLKWPDVDLLAVTTVAEHQGKRAGYARYTLGLVGREAIPVGAGADVDQTAYRERPGLPDEAAYWPEPIPPTPTTLAYTLDLLESSIRAGAIIAATGPFTNLALLEKRSPGILREAKLFLMGGYVFPIRAGFPAWGNMMDFNIQVDVESAYTVMTRSNPTLIPLTVTVETWLRRAHLDRLNAAGALGRLLARQAEAHAAEYQNEARLGQTCAGLPDDTINFQHDPLACAVALGWREGVTIEEIPLKFTITDGWLHETVDTSGAFTKIVTQIDGARFSAFWLDMVTGGGAN